MQSEVIQNQSTEKNSYRLQKKFKSTQKGENIDNSSNDVMQQKEQIAGEIGESLLINQQVQINNAVLESYSSLPVI